MSSAVLPSGSCATASKAAGAPQETSNSHLRRHMLYLTEVAWTACPDRCDVRNGARCRPPRADPSARHRRADLFSGLCAQGGSAARAYSFLALYLLSRWNMRVHPHVVAESDRVPEHDRDPYFNAYAEGDEDVTLPCRILDLDLGGTGLVFLTSHAAAGNVRHVGVFSFIVTMSTAAAAAASCRLLTFTTGGSRGPRPPLPQILKNENLLVCSGRASRRTRWRRCEPGRDVACTCDVQDFRSGFAQSRRGGKCVRAVQLVPPPLPVPTASVPRAVVPPPPRPLPLSSSGSAAPDHYAAVLVLVHNGGGAIEQAGRWIPG
mmetsp:Transcript_14193/g.28308  ORF Transcript_14193/g.28308 Transcript_14193/m.28308 type:complete len:319 (-) Transcript_14193:270-1226(-)